MKAGRFVPIFTFVLWLATLCPAQSPQQTWVAVPAPPLSPNITTLIPQQQIGGDYVSLWDKCCSGEPQPYSVQTNGHYQTNNQVWGLDEGVSTASVSGRVYWFFGDTETVFPDNGTWGIFGLFNGCIANGTGGPYPTTFDICLGNDSMAFTEPNQVALMPQCAMIPSLEWYANNGYSSSAVPVSGPGSLYNNCNLTQFINDPGSTGASTVAANVHPALPPDDSMAGGLTPNGAFTLEDGNRAGTPESIFLIYTVKQLGGGMEQVPYPYPNGPLVYFGTPSFLTRSALLRSSPTSAITASNPPSFAPNVYDAASNLIGTFSEVPTGTVSITSDGQGGATMALCLGDPIVTQWSSQSWHIAISDYLNQYDYFNGFIPNDFGTNPNKYKYIGPAGPGGVALPYTGTMNVNNNGTVTIHPGTGATLPANSTCAAPYQYAAIPREGSVGTPGKFMHVSAEVMQTSTMPGYLKNKLPWTQPNMPATVVFFFGASLHYRSSNLYLAVMDANDVLNDGGANQAQLTRYIVSNGSSPQGLNNAYYLSYFAPSSDPVNNPDGDTVIWNRGDETQAAPLFTNWTNQGTGPRLADEPAQPCIGEQSVRYQTSLLDNSSANEPNRPLFLLTYGSWDCGGLYARSSIVPWGQWGGEFQFFSDWPQYFNTPYHGDNPTGGVAGQYNPEFTLWYPQLIHESQFDGAVIQNDPFLVNAATTNGDESFSTDLTIPNNELFCRYGGSYWGDPVFCPIGELANLRAITPFVDVHTGVGFTGNPYGAYQYPAFTTTVTNGTATVIMNMSTFNPYKVFQTSVTFKAQAPPAN